MSRCDLIHIPIALDDFDIESKYDKNKVYLVYHGAVDWYARNVTNGLRHEDGLDELAGWYIFDPEFNIAYVPRNRGPVTFLEYTMQLEIAQITVP